jgi:hypothetical protein
MCGAHAFNALLGGRVVSGDAMRDYLSYRWPAGRRDGKFSEDGWFSIDAINFWLHEHMPPGTEWGLYNLNTEFSGPLNVTKEDLQTCLEVHGQRKPKSLGGAGAQPKRPAVVPS